MQYSISISETLLRVVTVDAISSEEALEMVKKLYRESEIVLDSSDFVSVNFCTAESDECRLEMDVMEIPAIQLNDPLLCDRLQILAAEYSTSVELLVNIAVKCLLDDVELFRDLRAGKINME